MDSKTKVWIKSMLWFDKYWGCHQIPERSFFIRGYQLPVCARCTGIIIGYFFAITLWFIWSPGWYIAFLLIPLTLDGVTQYVQWRTSNNILRLVTGVLFGYSVLTLLFILISYVVSLFK